MGVEQVFPAIGGIKKNTSDARSDVFIVIYLFFNANLLEFCWNFVIFLIQRNLRQRESQTVA